MTWQMLAAHQLAHELECMRAKGEAKSRNRWAYWEHYFDPHAATELAALILVRMTKNGKFGSLPFEEMCEKQGLPGDFLADSPLTVSGKRQAVGNGVPIPLGRAIARAVVAALHLHPKGVVFD